MTGPTLELGRIEALSASLAAARLRLADLYNDVDRTAALIALLEADIGRLAEAVFEVSPPMARGRRVHAIGTNQQRRTE